MKQEYILLHDTRPSGIGVTFPLRRSGIGLTFPLATSRGGLTPRPSLTANTPAEIRIDTETLSEKHANEARSQPDVFVAPKMPTKLVAPVDVANGQADPAWGIDAVAAATSPWTGAGVKVAILDTGINSNHTAFQGLQISEKDFSGSGNGDKQGHGTHVAGTVFGRDVNNTRIGVATGVSEVLIGKVLDDNGSGTTEMIFRGIQWALNSGAKVINMSLGFDFPGYVDWLANQGVPVDLATSMALKAYRDNSNVFEALMELATSRIPFDGGAVVVGAAGNESKRDINADYEISVSLPADTQDIISVGALQNQQGGLDIAGFSNTNPLISAPGVGIVSADANTPNDGLIAMNGTSMAAPHVAGCAALWWQATNQMELPNSAETVVAKMTAFADLQALAPNVDPADRGNGVVQAPQ